MPVARGGRRDRAPAGGAALAGVLVAGISHSMMRVLFALPGAKTAQGAVAVGAAGVLIVGVVVYLLARIFSGWARARSDHPNSHVLGFRGLRPSHRHREPGGAPASSVDEGLGPRRQTSSTKPAAPAIRAPGSRSASVSSRRAAHWVQTVTRPPARRASRSSASGAAYGRTNSSARPGTASYVASPVSHTLDLRAGSRRRWRPR